MDHVTFWHLILPQVTVLAICVGLTAIILLPFAIRRWWRFRKEMQDPTSVTYGLQTGDWSHWSGTELSLAYIFSMHSIDPTLQIAIDKELNRRGIRR